MGDNSVFLGPIDTVVIFGGGISVPDFACEAISSGLSVTVFAAPRHLTESLPEAQGQTLQEILTRHSIHFFSSENINNSIDLNGIISEQTLGIGLGEVYTFSKKTISLFKGRLFDFMVIPLPQYRGGAHFTWQILRGDRHGCWNIQRINEEMVPGVFDSGEIIKFRKYLLPPEARIPQDYFDAARFHAKQLFTEFLSEIREGKGFNPAPLQEELRTYYPRLSTIMQGYIDWSWSTDEIERFICAFDNPYPGASTFLSGKQVFLKSCRVHTSQNPSHPFMAGLIYRTDKSRVFIATRDGALIVDSVLDETNKNILSSVKPGERFFTPRQYLDNAMLFTAKYDARGLVKERGAR